MKIFFVGLIVCFVGSAAVAQQPPEDRNTVNIGIGATLRPSYDGSNDYVVGPAAIVRGKVAGFAFQTEGTQVSVDLIRKVSADGVKITLGPVAGVGLNRTSQIRDPRVAALGNIRAAAQLGGLIGIQKVGVFTSAFDSLSFDISYIHDVGSVHRSSIITPKIRYTTPLSRRTFISITGSATIVGDRYARTYFGITSAGSAASGLRRYDLKGGLKSVGVTVIGAQSLGQDIRRGASLFAVAGYSKLLGRFNASPIVAEAGNSHQAFAAVGVGYSF